MPAWIQFTGAAQIAQLRRTVTKKGKKTVEVVYLITSADADTANPTTLATWIREHWHVENKLHWVRHVTYQEDKSLVRTSNAPRVMATLRNLAISLLRLNGHDNIAAANRHHARDPAPNRAPNHMTDFAGSLGWTGHLSDYCLAVVDHCGHGALRHIRRFMEGIAMHVSALDHIELFVDDVERTAVRLCEAFGFAVCGYGGLDTSAAGARSILLRQGGITLLITTALDDGHRAAEYVRKHGDGVAVVGLAVPDAEEAFTEAVAGGCRAVAAPVVMSGQGERVTFASVSGFGDIEHRFVSRERNSVLFAPGMIDQADPIPPAGGLLSAVDHLAVLVPIGELSTVTRMYQEVFGFVQTYEETIEVGHQAMNSKVMANVSGNVTFTIIEPDITRYPGQIDTFLRMHGGAGVQHVAFLTSDIVESVRTVSSAGVRFLSTPASYYDVLPDRVGKLGVLVETLRELNILADRDQWGTILQIFTETEHPRRTLFYELIERCGARTFGSNNIKALYEAVERQGDTATQAGIA